MDSVEAVLPNDAFWREFPELAPAEELKKLKAQVDDTAKFDLTLEARLEKKLGRSWANYYENLRCNLYLANSNVYVLFPLPGSTLDSTKRSGRVVYPFNVNPNGASAMLVVIDELGNSTKKISLLELSDAEKETLELSKLALDYLMRDSQGDQRRFREEAARKFLLKYRDLRDNKDPYIELGKLFAYSATYDKLQGFRFPDELKQPEFARQSRKVRSLDFEEVVQGSGRRYIKYEALRCVPKNVIYNTIRSAA